MNILALDWGKTVGLASWKDGVHASWMLDWRYAWSSQVPSCIYSQPVPPAVSSLRPDLVVCEDFEIGPRTIRSAVAKDWKRGRELMLIGATEFMCMQTGVEFVLQRPADAKQFSTDTKLKSLGWWHPGPDHANDASRHLLLFLVREGLMGVEELRHLV